MEKDELINEFFDWIKDIQDSASDWVVALASLSKAEGKTYAGAIRYLKSKTPDLPRSYHASSKEYIANIATPILDEAIKKVRDEAMSEEAK
ncbi:MAG: hypothetical protein HDR41_00670 [Lactobacillus sp.]|nr:hypothetical protein [Lactobacillus sp.]